jgi:IclR family KDG regulon transcriptional repressor
MIQVIHRALDILECVASDKTKPKLLGEIANELNLKPSTCANIVKTLLDRDYLQKAENQKGYEIGKQLLVLSDKNGYQKKLIAAAQKELEQLTNMLNENSLIAVLNGDKRIIVNHKLSKQIVQAQTPVEKNAYDSSTGRLLIALKSDPELESYILQYGLPSKKVWPGINAKKDLYEQIITIRKNGYVLIEDSIQIVGFAAPIKVKGEVMASLSIYMPAFRYNDDTRKKFIDLGLAAAERISAKLDE